MRFLLITRTRIYKHVINHRSGNFFLFFRTASRYGLEAISLHAAGKDSYLTLRRLLKCYPLPRWRSPCPNNW